MSEQSAAVQRPPTGVRADPFRAVLGEVVSQVVVATTSAYGRPHGTTITAFTSLSLDPPLVAISLNRDSLLLARLRVSGRFGVNVLAHDQEAIASRCSGKEDDKFASVPWVDADGLPRIVGTAGWLACDIWDEVPVGDHVLVVGHVIDAATADPDAAGQGARRSPAPLIYGRRTFGTHSRLNPVALSA